MSGDWKFWQTPRLRDDEESEKHRPVTWLELFFDLYFVVALAQLAHQLGGDPTWHGVMTFVVLFLPLIWVWIGITYYMERFETTGIDNRAIILVYMLCVGGMANFAHDGLESNYFGYMLSYAAARGFAFLLWVRAGWHNVAVRPAARVQTVGLLLGLTCVLTSVAVPTPLRFVLLGAGLLCDIVTPVFAIRHNAKLPRISTSKHPERFGLFTIIVLGETVVGVVAGLSENHHPTLADGVGGMLGVLIGFTLWWIYFDFVARRPFRPGLAPLYGWVYLHVLVFMSIAVVGAAILNATRQHGDVLHVSTRYMVVGGIGAFLLFIGLLETLLVRAPEEHTHAFRSPAMKIACGVALPFLGVLEVDKFAFFACFYPFLLVHGIYSVRACVHRGSAEKTQ